MDPLEWFPQAKVAADKEKDDIDREPVWADRDSPDSGERALAGLAVTSSLGARAVPWLIDEGLQHVATAGDVPWPWRPVGKVKNLTEIYKPTDLPKSKLLGLFDVDARPSRMSRYFDDYKDAVDELADMTPAVESFMERHKKRLPKNLHMSFYGGQTSGTPEYRFLEKRVHLPVINKPQVLHELGHAVDASSRIGKARYYATPMIENAMLAALPVAFLAGDEIKKMIPGTIDDRAIDFLKDNAPTIAGATLAATNLYPEAKASYYALEHLGKTEGSAAVRQAAKSLGPLWLSAAVSTIPTVVGMAFARKYMREAGEQEKEISERQKKILAKLEKTSGIVGDFGEEFVQPYIEQYQEWFEDLKHVGKQVQQGATDLVEQPGRAKKIVQAAKNIGKSPYFLHGALNVAVPATLGALYLYSTKTGKVLRQRTPPGERDLYFEALNPDVGAAKLTRESWREKNPLKFAGLVGLGAALSGGVLAKFWADLHKVL